MYEVHKIYKELSVLPPKLLNAHSVHCCVSVVGYTLNLLQRLESKVFNKDAWSDVDGFATLLLNELFSRFTHPFTIVGFNKCMHAM